MSANSNLSDSAHRLGTIFASVVLVAGMGLAVFNMVGGAKPMEMAETGGYTLGLAVLAYVVVRVVGWFFGTLMGATREHRARRP